jgi:protein-disulfide isomerase
MKNNISIIGILIGCVVLVGGLYAMTAKNNTVGKELTADQKSVLTVASNDHVVNAKPAKATLIEYFDYECPPCGSYYPIVHDLQKKHTDVQFVFRYFPLSGHMNALNAAHAAEAAAQQGKYAEMSAELFEHQDEWGAKDAADASLFVKYAKEIGLDMVKWEAARSSDEVRKLVQDSFDAGVTAGVRGTPSFFLNGTPLDTPRSAEDFSKILTDAVAAPASVAAPVVPATE